MKLKVKKLHNLAQLPCRNKSDDCGYDLFSVESKMLKAGETTKVDTGIAVQIERDADDYHLYALFIHERSSVGSKGIGRRAGVIDFSYTGPLVVCLTNHTDRDYEVLRGDKIAQLVIQRVETPFVEEVEELTTTDRGSNGFGSSGR